MDGLKGFASDYQTDWIKPLITELIYRSAQSYSEHDFTEGYEHMAPVLANARFYKLDQEPTNAFEFEGKLYRINKKGILCRVRSSKKDTKLSSINDEREEYEVVYSKDNFIRDLLSHSIIFKILKQYDYKKRYVWEFKKHITDKSFDASIQNPEDKSWYYFKDENEIVEYESRYKLIHNTATTKVTEILLSSTPVKAKEKVRKSFVSKSAGKEEVKKDESIVGKAKASSILATTVQPVTKITKLFDTKLSQLDVQEFLEPKENATSKEKNTDEEDLEMEPEELEEDQNDSEEDEKETMLKAKWNKAKELVGKIDLVDFEYKVQRPNQGTVPYKAEFTEKGIGQICKSLVLDQSLDGLTIGQYTRADNLKMRDIRRWGNYEDAGYENDPIRGKRLKVNSKVLEANNTDSQLYSDKRLADFDSPKTENVVKNAFFTIGLNKNLYIDRTFKVTTYACDTDEVSKLKGELDIKPLDLENELSMKRYFKESEFQALFNNCFGVEYNANEPKYSKSCWVHLMLGMTSMLEDMVNNKLEYPLFDLYSIDMISKVAADYELKDVELKDVELKDVELKSEEAIEVLLEQDCDVQLSRIQNFWINLSYRSLLYYYMKEGTNNFSEETVMIYIKNYEEAEVLASIDDLSILLIKLLKYPIITYKASNLVKYKNGVLVIMDKLCFAEYTPYVIPAYLPRYIVVLKDQIEEEEEYESKHSSKKSKKSKKSKESKKSKRKSISKGKVEEEVSDGENEPMNVKKGKKSKNSKAEKKSKKDKYEEEDEDY